MAYQRLPQIDQDIKHIQANANQRLTNIATNEEVQRIIGYVENLEKQIREHEKKEKK